jgi:hypothetical protein
MAHVLLHVYETPPTMIAPFEFVSNSHAVFAEHDVAEVSTEHS